MMRWLRDVTAVATLAITPQENSAMRTTILTIGAIMYAASFTEAAEINRTVWYCADNIYNSADPGVVGAMLARNVSQADGALQIAVKKETVECLPTRGGKPVRQPYTAGVLYTKPVTFTYGDVDVRAKMTGPGTWPAVWLMDARCQATYWIVVPCLNAPIRREIDIAEYMPGSCGPRIIQQTVHNFEAGRYHTFGARVDDVTKWHLYRLEWSRDLVVFKIDGAETFRVTKDVPQVPMFLCLGLSGLNGPSGGRIDDRTLPQTMYVDYARVTQNGKIIFADDFGGPCRIP